MTASVVWVLLILGYAQGTGTPYTYREPMPSQDICAGAAKSLQTITTYTACYAAPPPSTRENAE